MNRAVEFEDNRRRAVRAVRSGTAVVLAALALAGCERSKVVIELKWDPEMIDPENTTISVMFKDDTSAVPRPQWTTDQKDPTGKLPKKQPLTLVYFVDDPNKPLDVRVDLMTHGMTLNLCDRPWTGKINLCAGGCDYCPENCRDGGTDAESDASGGHGGTAAGGQPGSGGASGGSGGAAGAGGAGGAMTAGSGGVGGRAEGGMTISPTGGRTGDGGKGAGGMPISPAGGAKGSGGVTGSGGAAVGGSPGTGGVGVGGSATGGSASGGSMSTGGVMGTGGMMGTGGSPPPPSCLQDPSNPCSCDDYCDALAMNCASSNYFIPVASPSHADCVASCMGFNWTAGTNDPSNYGDTIGCRVARALEKKCLSASPTGGNICGLDRCITYCGALDRNCSGNMLHPYPNGDCIQACMRPPAISWETTTDKLVMTSAMGDITTGDCRLYWAGQAGETTDKTTACKKAGPMSMVCR